MSLTEAAFEAGRSLKGIDEDALAGALGSFLAGFMGWPYAVAPAMLEGPDGQRTGAFPAVVFSTADGGAVSDAGTVPVVRTAAVVDACDELTLDGMGAAYGRIVEAKRLRQAVPATGERRGHRDGVVGVILGLGSSMTLEAIAEEMQRLNEGIPGTEWPDLGCEEVRRRGLVLAVHGPPAHGDAEVA